MARIFEWSSQQSADGTKLLLRGSPGTQAGTPTKLPSPVTTRRGAAGPDFRCLDRRSGRPSSVVRAVRSAVRSDPSATGLAGLVALLTRLPALLTGLSTLLFIFFHIVCHEIVLPFRCATWRTSDLDRLLPISCSCCLEGLGRKRPGTRISQRIEVKGASKPGSMECSLERRLSIVALHLAFFATGRHFVS